MAMIRVHPDVDELAAILMPDGPDSETGLAVRKAIMDQFAGAYLKSLTKEPAFTGEIKKLADAMSKDATNAVRDEFLEVVNNRWRLRAYTGEAVTDHLRQAFHGMVDEAIKARIEPEAQRVEEAIKRRLDVAIKYWYDHIGNASQEYRDAERQYLAAAAKLEAAAESLTVDHLEPMVDKAVKAYLDAKFGK